MMQRVFRDQLDPSADITMKYKDEDGDLITLFDSADLAAAIAYSRVLKLTLFVNGKIVSGPGGQQKVSSDVVGELRSIRDQINRVLDKIGDQGVLEKSCEKQAIDELVNEMESLEAKNGIKPESKEFDPLQKLPSTPAAQSSVPDDQQSVSSQASAQVEQPPVSVAPAPPAMNNAPRYPTPQQPQQHPGYPGYPAYPGYPQAPVSLPAATEASKQVNGPQIQQQQAYPAYSMPQHMQMPAAGSQQQMSAFMGYPQQQQPQTNQQQQPQQPPVSSGQSAYPPASAVARPPSNVPMPGAPANPYGMGGTQRGPNPGFGRYPQPPTYQ